MNYQDILFIINFVILFYIIYKINSLENDKIETFDATTDAAITTAVKQVYSVDVDAIRSLSKFAIALSQGGMTVPGNLTISGNQTVDGSIKGNRIDFGYNDTQREGNSGKIEYGTFGDALCIVGKGNNATDRKIHLWDDVGITRDLTVGGNHHIKGHIFSMGRTNYPANWRGGIRTVDVYASGAYGLGDENGNLITKIDNGGISTNKIIVGTSADGVSNTITDGQHDGSALCIVGKTSNGSRRVKLWDDVIIDRNLVVSGSTTTSSLNVSGNQTVDGYTTLKGGASANGAQTHFPYSDGNNYIRGNTIFDKGSIKVGGWTIRDNNGGCLEFIRDGTTYNNDYSKIPADHGFVAIHPWGDIWVNRSVGKRGWVADIPTGTINCSNINTNNINVKDYLNIGKDWKIFQSNVYPRLCFFSNIVVSDAKKNYNFDGGAWKYRVCNIGNHVTDFINDGSTEGGCS